MIPQYYFSVICCPICKSDLSANDGVADELICTWCGATYPVVNDIPVLLDDVEDEVSKIIKDFYDSEWQRNEAGILSAKIEHEDLSDFGQQYIQVNEKRFLSTFQTGHVFLDAASGAQPRKEFGQGYKYHVCVDFSLDGLLESRRVLGDRAICVCGSLLNLPIKDGLCEGIIASHCLYHIDATLQERAILELIRTLSSGGKLLIFYGNPDSIERKLITNLKKVLKRQTKSDLQSGFYFYTYPIDEMLKMVWASNLSNKETHVSVKVEVKTLRLFSRKLTAPMFKIKPLDRLMYKILGLVESLLRHKPAVASYLAYIISK